ncbi:hypothetical protein OED52_17160 [Rhodococcus sp. Z13]|uniref:Uncharacterized protein n=1 Tax=Rhodococcus sacchari TaxID=2962047 RepID=A0ACD4DEB1_9NOCA|nr:hypothetical protein [Rhodococcus sp. Z13]UYP18369.1 hypothetical protein OED52_17160 [Rhodococcus sp. Z13]
MDDLSQYRADLDRIEQRVAGELVLGRTRVRILAGCVALLVVGLILPQASSVTSLTSIARWDAETVALPLRIFDLLALVFGVLVPIVALLRRRWRIAALATLGTGAASMIGLFAYWSQAGADVPSPHVGLFVCWAAVVLSTVAWLPAVLAAPPLRTAPPLTGGVLVPRRGTR